jgi:hypothetical protein
MTTQRYYHLRENDNTKEWNYVKDIDEDNQISWTTNMDEVLKWFSHKQLRKNVDEAIRKVLRLVIVIDHSD